MEATGLFNTANWNTTSYEIQYKTRDCQWNQQQVASIAVSITTNERLTRSSWL